MTKQQTNWGNVVPKNQFQRTTGTTFAALHALPLDGTIGSVGLLPRPCHLISFRMPTQGSRESELFSLPGCNGNKIKSWVDTDIITVSALHIQLQMKNQLTNQPLCPITPVLMVY